MLFVEQPAGTGFSYGELPETETNLSIQFYNFLVNFYDTFDMYPKRLFIFGESYAGMYVPSIARQIYTENKKEDTKKMNLKGIGIGNGWMDAKVQGPMVIDYAWWHGMIDSSARNALHGVWEDCKVGAYMGPPHHDFTVPDECNIMGAVLEAAGSRAFPPESFRSPNLYVVSTFDLYPVLFNPNSMYYKFFNDPGVKKALNAPLETEWIECIPGAGRRLAETLPGQLLLAHDKPESVLPYVAELLDEAGIKVLVYNGDRDLSTGSETFLDEMEWSGSKGWKTANRGLWMVADQVAGYSKVHKDLAFIVVVNSGHLVPNNVPVQALDLITRFVTDEDFLDISLPSFNAPKHPAKKAELAPRFHFIHLLAVALVCFFCGILTSTYRARKKQHAYSRISDVALSTSMCASH